MGQVAVLLMLGLYCTIWDRYMQILYLGRAPRTKETLLDFHEKCLVARHSRVFRGLTGSQRTPGFRGITKWVQYLVGPLKNVRFLKTSNWNSIICESTTYNTLFTKNKIQLIVRIVRQKLMQKRDFIFKTNFRRIKHDKYDH